jgi:SAM-dependent methyltransferase
MSIKQHVSNGLRKAGLLGLSDKLRYGWQKWRYSSINKGFIAENPSVKFPPPYFIYETYRLNYAEYYNDGRGTAAELTALIRKHSPIGPGARILDWGCGPARLVRHIPAILPQAKIYGTDYNRDYIEWCRANIPDVAFSVNEIVPPLLYSDDFFSGIIGLSIFTHLSEEMHEEWIEELHRITKPGGIVVITTQGQGYRHKLLQDEQRLFDAGKIVVRKNFKQGHRLYAAFQPQQAILDLVKNKFIVAEWIEGKEATQDIWVLKKQ